MGECYQYIRTYVTRRGRCGVVRCGASPYILSTPAPNELFPPKRVMANVTEPVGTGEAWCGVGPLAGVLVPLPLPPFPHSIVKVHQVRGRSD